MSSRASNQVANFFSYKSPSARFVNEFFIGLREFSANGSPDDLHYILNNTYVVRHPDGSATKTTVKNRAQLLALLTDRFGLRATDVDLPDLTRFLFEGENLATHQYVPRRPIVERELVSKTPINTLVSTPSITSTTGNSTTCPKCGTFEKSGRVSCCAPGGAWFKNCAGPGNMNVDHRWSEGVEACKSTFRAEGT